MTHDLPGVFFDQHAEMDNDDERSAVEKHISVLWDFAMTKEDFSLKSVQDVLQDLAFYQKQTKILRSKNVSFSTPSVVLFQYWFYFCWSM